MKSKQKGILFMVGAYMMWGVYPLYWKQIDYVPALEVLCHRITWCFAAVLVVLFFTKQFHLIRMTLNMLRQNTKKAALLILEAITLNMNWLLYIWAVQNGHIGESSMGYYINPLVSVLLGVVFLREKLKGQQKLAFLFAFLGVLLMAVFQGTPPWISLGLALTFGFYGLLKKIVGLGALSGLTLESAILCFFSVPWLIHLTLEGNCYLFSDGYTAVFLLGAGVVTLLPLLLFSAGVLLLPLTMTGFLQYINPTMQLLLGTLLYHEAFTLMHGAAFGLIWIGVLLFTLSDLRTKPGETLTERKPVKQQVH